jgi:hypothetical protein
MNDTFYILYLDLWTIERMNEWMDDDDDDDDDDDNDDDDVIVCKLSNSRITYLS